MPGPARLTRGDEENPMSYDLVIKNANIVDGSGSEAQRGSVGVAGGKIVALEKALSGGKREIDAQV